jgi:hypothetical protein
LADNITATLVSIALILSLSLPSFIAVMALTLMMSVGMNGKVRIKQQKIEIRKLDYAIAAIFLSTILLTIIGNVLFDISPVLSFLAGLSVMFIVARLCNDDDDHDPILNTFVTSNLIHYYFS